MAVYAVDDEELVAGSVWSGLNNEVVRTDDVVFFHILAYEVDKLGSELLCLALAHALAVLQLVQGDRVHYRHILQGRV